VKEYRLSPWRRMANLLIRRLVPFGLAGKHIYLLSVRGRRTGQQHSTPVRLVESERERWLVAPYGEVGWVRNARAAGVVGLSRAGRSETARALEVSPEEAAPVLREYLRHVPIVRPFFDATPDAPVEAFVKEAARHPVFRLVAEE
jgi:deazaflavin-dependent oxidoreductase (nitroreductase family)